MDCCGASLRRGLAGNSGGTRSGGRLAGRAEAFRKHDRQITNSWLLVREVYLYKNPRVRGRAATFPLEAGSAYPKVLRQTASPLFDSTVAWRSHNGVSDTG